MRSKARVITAVLACIVMPAFGEVRYTVTDLGTVEGRTVSLAYGVNASGEVAGVSYTPYAYSVPWRAFIWKDGAMTALEPLNGTATWGNDINDAGQVVGYEETPTGALLWDNGTTVALGRLPGVTTCVPYKINSGGVIVGDAAPYGGVLWRNGAMYDLDSELGESGWDNCEPSAINDLDHVVGMGYLGGRLGGFLWRNGPITELSDFEPRAINNDDQVVGLYLTNAAVWHDGVLTILGRIPNGLGTQPQDINNLGQVVGADQSHAAFLWENGTIANLNDLIPSDSGCDLVEASAINDAGQIAGWGTNPRGDEHAFLLTPIPEPATALLLSLGGLTLIRRRRA